jgi:hypothetical protein
LLGSAAGVAAVATASSVVVCAASTCSGSGCTVTCGVSVWVSSASGASVGAVGAGVGSRGVASACGASDCTAFGVRVRFALATVVVALRFCLLLMVSLLVCGSMGLAALVRRRGPPAATPKRAFRR